MAVNLNKMAREITLAEGLKKSVSIAQVKEVMKLVFTEVGKMTTLEIAGIVKKYKTG